LVPEAGVEPA